ncbi:MAG: DUF2971 domain-containing protein [Pseudomonadales bacterium]|nr:DUF2971 domain-containing protein [Pseudomonadales bacterium]MCP5204110.1 DUF2971 domain-containing protein [Pseudomonadales bacterium]
MIEDITDRLFSAAPQTTLYHYSTLAGVLGIVSGGELRASDIRYMNDSAELRHTLDVLRSYITRRVLAGSDNPGLLNELLEWLSHRIVSGPMVFGASFRANGNLLSQWRGYSVHGKGVSLGFNPQQIHACARRQQFQIGKCVYDPVEQTALMEQLVDVLEKRAAGLEPAVGAQANPGRWHRLFEQVEGDLLRVAAILKHPSFEEEQEWRIVSPVLSGGQDNRIHFREGTSMLVPYYAFDLGADDGSGLALDHVYLGPTSNIELSLKSLELFLAKHRVLPGRGITYCDIPYRQR